MASGQRQTFRDHHASLRLRRNDQCATGGKITGGSLIVKGLKGYEHINETIKTTTPNANLKAREVADKGYSK